MSVTAAESAATLGPPDPGAGRPPRRDWLFRAGLTVLAVVVLTALLAPWIAPYDPNAADFWSIWSPPGGEHLLGTDQLGRDLLSRVMSGARPTLLGALGLLAIAAVLGVSTGLTAAWRGGWVDTLLSRVTDVMYAFPGLLFVVLVVAVFSSGTATSILGMALAFVPTIAKYTRTVALQEISRPYVESYRLQGAGPAAICLRYLLPNLTPALLGYLVVLFGDGLISLAALNFIGFGSQPPSSDWGLMVEQARSGVIQGQLGPAIVPGLAIALVAVCTNVVGVRLSDKLPQEDAMSPALLDISQLNLTIRTEEGPRKILSDVALRVADGETVGLVGESGSGKSTTARAALRLLPDGSETSGRVSVCGVRVDTGQPEAVHEVRSRHAAMIFQDPRTSMNPVRRIADSATERLVKVRGERPARARERLLGLFAEVGLRDPEALLRYYPHQLSGGMLQRVMIAAALSTEPRLVLADEATSALDVTTQAEVLVLLRRLQRESGMGMLFITHDLLLAGFYCDRVYVMRQGEIVESQPADRIFRHPESAYTRDLAAATPTLPPRTTGAATGARADTDTGADTGPDTVRTRTTEGEGR